MTAPITTMTNITHQTGIVLFAHGSRDPLWHKPMEAVAARIVAASAQTPVECAYLEISTPDLTTATHKLIALGVNAITVVPLFLGVGKHAREDLPQLLANLQTNHPEVKFTLQPAVGEDVRLIQLIANIALERL
jgi:sirohydrochlorin cobaltochelatase